MTPLFRDEGMFLPQVRLMEWVEAWAGASACLFRMCLEEREIVDSPPTTPPNPWILWLKITPSRADVLIHAYIRAHMGGGGSWWIKSQTEGQSGLIL